MTKIRIIIPMIGKPMNPKKDFFELAPITVLKSWMGVSMASNEFPLLKWL
jgi:hypothetical protein